MGIDTDFGKTVSGDDALTKEVNSWNIWRRRGRIPAFRCQTKKGGRRYGLPPFFCVPEAPACGVKSKGTRDV